MPCYFTKWVGLSQALALPSTHIQALSLPSTITQALALPFTIPCCRFVFLPGTILCVYVCVCVCVCVRARVHVEHLRIVRGDNECAHYRWPVPKTLSHCFSGVKYWIRHSRSLSLSRSYLYVRRRARATRCNNFAKQQCTWEFWSNHLTWCAVAEVFR